MAHGLKPLLSLAAEKQICEADRERAFAPLMMRHTEVLEAWLMDLQQTYGFSNSEIQTIRHYQQMQFNEFWNRQWLAYYKPLTGKFKGWWYLSYSGMFEGRGFSIHESMMLSMLPDYVPILCHKFDVTPSSITLASNLRTQPAHFEEEPIKVVGTFEVGSMVSVTLFDKCVYTGTLCVCAKKGGNATDVFKLQGVTMKNVLCGETDMVYEATELIEFNMYLVDSIVVVPVV